MMTRKDKGADREANLEWFLSAQIMWKINWNWSWFLVSVFISCTKHFDVESQMLKGV
jgi:hypothetical protein